MTVPSTLDLAAAVVLDPNARATIIALAKMDRQDHTLRAVYHVLRDKFGDVVTMRLVERSLDRLVDAGVVERRTWTILEGEERLVGYRIKWPMN